MRNDNKRTFNRDLNALDDVSQFIGAFVADNEVDSDSGFSVDLAVEELFTNMVKYNPDGSPEIEIGLSKDDSRLTVVLVDFFSPPFDLTQYEPPDVKACLRDRKPGGLGILLVQRLMDEILYEWVDHQSRITLVKKLVETHV